MSLRCPSLLTVFSPAWPADFGPARLQLWGGAMGVDDQPGALAGDGRIPGRVSRTLNLYLKPKPKPIFLVGDACIPG